MDFDVSEQVNQLAKLPPVPKKPDPKWSAWSAPLRSVPAGASSLLAAGAEVATHVGKSLKHEGPGPAPWQGETDVSRSIRSVRDYYQNDPATASTAEKVVFEAGAFLTQAVPAFAVGGPAGAAATLAVSDGMRTSDELKAAGVDAETRTKVGVTTGMLAGGGAVLPAFGSTVGKTVGLWAAGGPGSFVAQQALTRKILEQANYTELAQQYDPADPTGLLVSSLIPAPFAALGIRGNLKASAAKKAEAFRSGPVPSEPTAVAAAVQESMPRDTVDAAMVHNLTLRRQEIESRGLVIEEAKSRPVETLEQFVQRTKPAAEDLGKPVESNFVKWIRDNGGLSMAEKLDITGEPGGVRSNPGGIFRNGGMSSDELALRAANEGYMAPDQAGDTGAFVDLVKRAVAGDRVLTFEQQMADAQVASKRAEYETRLEEVEKRLKTLGVDTAPAKGNLRALEDFLMANEDRLVRAAIEEQVTASRSAQIEAMPRQPVQEPEQISAARQALQDQQDSGEPVKAFIDRGTLPPDVQNLLIGLSEATKDQGERMLADFGRAVRSQPGRSSVDIAADVVEASRGGKTLTPEPAPVEVKPDQAAAQSMAARVAEVEQTMPDMVVGQTPDGQPITAKQLMEQARREAELGTADELGAADTDLLRVAADCALTMGS
jgi:hypothetical protein